MDKLYLQQLQKRLPSRPHVERTVDNAELWESQGKPYSWKKVEEKNNYEVFLDYSYDWLAVFKSGILLDCGKPQIITERAVIMDRKYFNVDKYIWTGKFHICPIY